MVIGVAETSIQVMAIAILETCHTEIAIIERTKKFDKWAQKANPLDKESERRFF